MISCERPYAFYALLVLIPAVFFAVRRYRKLIHSLGGFYGAASGVETAGVYRRLKISLLLRSITRIGAWIMLVFAYAGLSWGGAPVAVQKSGNAVCFVFDISYSMTAKDGPGGITRLAAVQMYAARLLDHMPETSVAVVLAKGNGITAVPLTEDRAVVDSLLDNLSPTLMTASGSSLGKGITAALNVFPPNSPQASQIWVFTDGDETDGTLASSLSDSVRYGIPVVLVGFGSEKEVPVLAGDGVTTVKTALRSARLKALAAQADKKVSFARRFSLLHRQPVEYIDASSSGSATELLKTLHGSGSSADTTFAYEMQPVSRQGIFLLFAIVLYCVSFIAGELVIPKRRPGQKKQHLVQITLLLCVCVPFFISCSSRTHSAALILKSSWAWNRKQYQQAVAGFLQNAQDASASGDTLAGQYAVYGLASTYLMQDEKDAALERLSQITPDAPQPVRYAALYTAGVIADRSGDYEKAQDFFKQAILVDGTKRDAKINLELSQKQETARQAQNGEREMKPVSEKNDESTLEKAVFSLIRENEQNTWKNKQTDKKDHTSLDY